MAQDGREKRKGFLFAAAAFYSEISKGSCQQQQQQQQQDTLSNAGAAADLGCMYSLKT